MKTIAKVFQHESGPVTLCIELDPSQVFPHDPGQGTPQLVVARRGGLSGRTIDTATLFCAQCEGELGCGSFPLTEEMTAWLNSPATEHAIEHFWRRAVIRP